MTGNWGKWALLPAFLLVSVLAHGQPCDPGGGFGGTGADVMVGELEGSIQSYGNAGGYYAYSVGTTSCNIGTAELLWIASTNQHPVIGQNMYRLKDGRFEHIGQSWLKHGFTALQQNACGCSCTSSGTGSRLGLGCSDPYSSSLNGSQGSLGAKSEITDPANGVFIYPQILDPANPDVTTRRLRVAADDMNPALNAGALYFVEGHYVSPDDAAAGNQDNNASYRQVNVGSNASNFPLSYAAPTQRQQPGIFAWKTNQPSVTLVEIDTADNGYMILGYDVTDNGDGTFHYEYALYNMNSTQAARSFSIPLPPGLVPTNIGFHDVEYHSGEPYDGTDWTANVTANAITWSTETHATNVNANALRWGTLYNFRFDAPVGPTAMDATVEHFAPGTGTDFTVPTLGPDGDSTLPVTNLTCVATDQDVDLSWTNGDSYDSITVTKDGAFLATLGGGATTYNDSNAGVGPHTYGVQGSILGAASGATECNVEVLPPVAINYPNGFPDSVNPLGATLQIQITTPGGGTLIGSGPSMFLDTGAGFTALTVNSLGGGLFEAVIPATTCGSSAFAYVTAEDVGGYLATDPADAPNTVYELTSASSLVMDLDDMETNSGWTVGAAGDSATTGIWTLGDPTGTAAQPEDDHTPAPGTDCWHTGASSPGQGLGSNDVDNGATTLVTPVFDMSQSVDPTISYWRWFSNDAGASPSTDVFVVEITNDGSNWIEVETVGPTGTEASGGWFLHEFQPASLLTLTSTVQLRFVAEDAGAGSIVEAAIDDLLISEIVCEEDCNNNGTPDATDISSGSSQDCNNNGSPDECDIASGLSLDGNMNGVPDECENATFQRGDCNADGGQDISDIITFLGILFNGEGPALCNDACDGNDDGVNDIADATFLLDALFGIGSLPADPYGACGADPTADALTCAAFPACP